MGSGAVGIRLQVQHHLHQQPGSTCVVIPATQGSQSHHRIVLVASISQHRQVTPMLMFGVQNKNVPLAPRKPYARSQTQRKKEGLPSPHPNPKKKRRVHATMPHPLLQTLGM